MPTPTINLKHPPKECRRDGLAAARTWATAQGYPLDAVPITPETVQAASDAGLFVWHVVHLIDRDTAIRVGLGYYFAQLVDGGPSDDTRAGAIAFGDGYLYARWIDRAPRDDTRAAAIKEGKGYWYAYGVDWEPRDDTRAAAIEEGEAYRYARFIDQGARDDTREAAIADGDGGRYEMYVPGA